MARRIHASQTLIEGHQLMLDSTQAHHVRDVLRLQINDTIELFDDAGTIAHATILQSDSAGVEVRIDRAERSERSWEIVIASAVPKGDRADWMVEKLSELGVSRFIPLAAERSVVLPSGQNKRDRWIRIATESAKQSRRGGVMRIDDLTDVSKLASTLPGAFFLDTRADAKPIAAAIQPSQRSIALLIGPEGGWSAGEVERFAGLGLTGVKLTGTILRVETAAVAAAAVVACQLELPQGK